MSELAATGERLVVPAQVLGAFVMNAQALSSSEGYTPAFYAVPTTEDGIPLIAGAIDDEVIRYLQGGTKLEPGHVRQVIDELKECTELRIDHQPSAGRRQVSSAAVSLLDSQPHRVPRLSITVGREGGQYARLDTALRVSDRDSITRYWQPRPSLKRIPDGDLNNTKQIGPGHRLYEPMLAVQGVTSLMVAIRERREMRPA
ncbi:MAG TPA: hypothetical protein VLF59_01310 [Candidatus Saccharimonadales bacterium]|nr:hypothetical protein [Candidatus Saccharimonadales bacterium]